MPIKFYSPNIGLNDTLAYRKYAERRIAEGVHKSRLFYEGADPLDSMKIIYSSVYKRTEEKNRESCAMNVDVLRDLHPSFHNVLLFMKSRDMLGCDNSYQKDVKSIHYWIPEDRLGEVAPTGLSSNALLHLLERKLCSRDIPRAVEKGLEDVGIDMRMAEIIASKEGDPQRKERMIMNARSLDAHGWRGCMDNFSGRVHTNATNMHREMRAALRPGGELPCEIDISNSQAMLLAAAISPDAHRLGLGGGGIAQYFPDRADKVDFCRLAKDGGIYEYVARMLGIPRGQAKKKLLSWLFSHTGEGASIDGGFESWMRRHWPSIYAGVTTVRALADGKELARALQKAEARIIIGKVAPRLAKAGISFATIHDSVVVPASRHKEAFAIMEEELQRSCGVARLKISWPMEEYMR